MRRALVQKLALRRRMLTEAVNENMPEVVLALEMELDNARQQLAKFDAQVMPTVIVRASPRPPLRAKSRSKDTGSKSTPALIVINPDGRQLASLTRADIKKETCRDRNATSKVATAHVVYDLTDRESLFNYLVAYHGLGPRRAKNASELTSDHVKALLKLPDLSQLYCAVRNTLSEQDRAIYKGRVFLKEF